MPVCVNRKYNKAQARPEHNAYHPSHHHQSLSEPDRAKLRRKCNDAFHDWKWNLFRRHPVVLCKYFSRMVTTFINVVKTTPSLIGPYQDYYYRVEYQKRGAPHVHMLVWIKGAPNLEAQLDKIAQATGQDKNDIHVERVQPEDEVIFQPTDDGMHTAVQIVAYSSCASDFVDDYSHNEFINYVDDDSDTESAGEPEDINIPTFTEDDLKGMCTRCMLMYLA